MNSWQTLYENDYPTWAYHNAELLRAGKFSEVDVTHLIEELEDMGNSQKDELESRLAILLAHLLKWQYQLKQLDDMFGKFEGKSWRASIIEQRNRIQRRLRKSPGLKSYFSEALVEAYADAVVLASRETGLPLTTFPNECPYSQVQILDDDYYPPHVI